MQAIRGVTNPDKLAHLGPVLDAREVLRQEPGQLEARQRQEAAAPRPHRAQQRVRDAADERDEPGDPRPAERRHERGGAEADQRSGEHVTRVVHAERDARESDQRGDGEEPDPRPAGEGEHGKGDRERRRGVVARERGIVVVRAPSTCVSAGCSVNGRGRVQRCAITWFVASATAVAINAEEDASFQRGFPYGRASSQSATVASA